MDDNGVQQLKEKIKHGQKTVSSLLKEYGSLLLKQMQTETTDDSDNSVKQALIDLVMELIQQQVQLALEQYYNISSTLPASEECSSIQSDDSQKGINNELEIANVIVNQVELPDIKGQNEAKLNTAALELLSSFNGTLPDDFYLLLMSVIGIQECLLSNRLVCSLWNELVLERCRNQKSLKLFETFDNLMEYGEILLQFEKTQDVSLTLKSIGDELIFERLEIEQLVNRFHQDEDYIQKNLLTREKKREASKVLTTIFPRVEQLVLCAEFHDARINLINIEYLLQFYAKQLTSLTMTSFGLGNESAGKLRAFSFPKLKSLNTFHFSPEDDQFLSLLPQLESLTLSRSEISMETLLRTGTQLRELNIGHLESVYTSPVAEFSKRPPINSHLRKFTLGSTENALQILEFISLNLTSLECLKLDLNQGNFPHFHTVIPYLVPLHQLHSLIHSLTLPTPVSIFFLKDNQFTEIQPLPSVRQLKLIVSGRVSLPMDLFSRALFAAFPKVEQVHIGFKCSTGIDGLVDDATLSAFEDFASEHPNVVKLFRSKTLSRFTSLSNAVSPLLGQHRQVYEEYIDEVEELSGMRLCKLATYLVGEGKEDRPGLKIALQPADRLAAMSHLFQLMEDDHIEFTSTFTCGWVNSIIRHFVDRALTYGPSESALFTVTCNCVLYLLGSIVVDDENGATSFLNSEDLQVYPFIEMMENLVDHYKTQQFNDRDLLFNIFERIVMLLKEFNSSSNDEKRLDEYELFKILLKLLDIYETEQLKRFEDSFDYDDSDYESYYYNSLLIQVHNMMDDQLKKFESETLNEVMCEFIRSENRVYRVEMARALLRICESPDNYFK